MLRRIVYIEKIAASSIAYRLTRMLKPYTSFPIALILLHFFNFARFASALSQHTALTMPHG
jgi:hypothetical protein